MQLSILNVDGRCVQNVARSVSASNVIACFKNEKSQENNAPSSFVAGKNWNLPTKHKANEK